ncbi:Phosphonomutase [Sphingomonas sp. EC-HK361]|uniref:isocitrate lyase/PEP mutase family protein n=1 Tax=Sphingomonas sp. EC-HK361 TaxID=2038397 RepID=UPI001257C4F9|nr:isocitrate lyase/phosphoenolpyruvate mutase family protein [Sphingomonas sp. EC-HK361]VVS99324.1 Phosphonomutase [Sphingomonas sp. EC-HK361]
MSRFATFAALHVRGTPVILFNAWDAGSAKVVAKAGATAIATGSWSVAAANGHDDGEALPIAVLLETARRIVASVDLPVSIDFEGGYAVSPGDLAANVARLKGTGAIGCNFEDQVVGGEGLHGIEAQGTRIAAMRNAVGTDFFINARTDIFLQAAPDAHDAAKVAEAVARGRAYAGVGASGFFVPGLVDLDLLGQVCREVPLPVNAMAFPGAPSADAFARAGVARISHGPGPYRIAMAALEDAARTAYAA